MCRTNTPQYRMLQRRREYEEYERYARKVFSSSQRIIIASHQRYMCVGTECKGGRLLPAAWEADHKRPLFQGGSNFYDFDKPDNPASNIQIICPTCHGLKTIREKQEFFATERRSKFNDKNFEMASSYYHREMGREKNFETAPREMGREKKLRSLDEFRFVKSETRNTREHPSQSPKVR